MRTFAINPFPYDDYLQLFKKKTISLNDGITVFVGCNGAGKSTLLDAMSKYLKQEKIPVLSYDYAQERKTKMQHSLEMGNIDSLMRLATTSEGEQIIGNFNEFSKTVINFLKNNGVTQEQEAVKALKALFSDTDEEPEPKQHTEYWILFDAIDSGLSIDNIIMLKNAFHTLLQSVPTDFALHIVVSCNDYEFCVGEQCFNVQEGEYVRIDSYDSFKDIVLATRKTKEDMWDAARKKCETEQKRKNKRRKK